MQKKKDMLSLPVTAFVRDPIVWKGGIVPDEFRTTEELHTWSKEISINDLLEKEDEEE